jgi:thiosulfate/3-mercaptopyruvate sulfurtransferase
MAAALLKSSPGAFSQLSKSPTLTINSKRYFRIQRYTPGVQQKTIMMKPKDLRYALQQNKLGGTDRTVPLCASWFMPNDPEGRTGLGVFQKNRIPSARFFDLDAIKDNSSPYPHMLPDSETFAKAMSELGIRKDDSVVVYDTSELGLFSAPRVAWTLKVFGHPKVKLLDNYKKWVESEYPLETGSVRTYTATEYPVPELDASKIISFEELKSILKKRGTSEDEGVQILDARPKGRWEGTDPEPRPGKSMRRRVMQ